MFYQIIGMNDPRNGHYDREVILGCIRIDQPNLVRSVEDSKFAFYAFLEGEKGSVSDSHCTIQGDFLVVSGYYPHMPESEEENRDVLFFHRDYKKPKKWKFLRPGHNGFSGTGAVVWGTKALDELYNRVKQHQSIRSR